jgi:hypothetical protein
MWTAVWEWLKKLFTGKGSTQIGRGNLAVSASSTGANSPVVSAGRDVHVTINGGAQSTAAQIGEQYEALRKSLCREPLSHVLPEIRRLAEIAGNHEIEHWARLELFGYFPEGGQTQHDKVPEYRTVVGQYFDEFNRVLRVPPKLHFVNQYRLRYGVATLEQLASRREMQNIADPGMIELFQQDFDVHLSRFCFNPIAVADVRNGIRNVAMDKLRELERAAV